MATAWFIASHKERQDRRARYCAMDDYTAEIFGNGGAWENQGDLVRVRAPHRLLRVLPFKELSETEARGACLPAELCYLASKIPERKPSIEVQQLYGLWAGVGFGKQWRLPRSLCGFLSGKGIEPTPLWNLTRVLWDQRGVFPTTGIIDAFNRANENPLSDGGNWMMLIGGDPGGGVDNVPLQVLSNQCTTTSANYGQYYRAGASYGPDIEAYITIATRVVAGAFAPLWVRVQQGGTTTYEAYLHYTQDTDDLGVMASVLNGSNTDLTPTFTQAYASGDAKGLEVIGTTVAAYRKASGGSWAQITTRSSSAVTGTGSVAFGSGHETVERLDDFGGGTVTAAGSLTPTIGSASLTGIASRMGLGMTPRTMVKIA